MRGYFLYSMAMVLLFGPASTVLAQDQDDPVYEEIVVTALKREQNLQDVGASITALTGDMMRDRGINTVQDLSKVVPNLNWGEHFGTTLITIRGVGSIVDSGITEPTVAMYTDGIFLPRSTMSTLRAIDVERVEVLRGPQGTLYGRNATGGAINFISSQPTEEFGGEVRLAALDRNGYSAAGYLSGPISDAVSYRLSVSKEKQDGYVDNLFNGDELNDVDTTYVRGVLRIQPTDSLQVDLAVRHEQSDAFNAIQQQLTPSFLGVPGQTTEPNKLFADQPMQQETETTVSSVTVNWDIGATTSFRSLTSFVDHESHADVDADATNVDGFNTVDFSRPSESWGQEFIVSGVDDTLSWLVGAYYYDEEASNRLPLRLGAVFAPGFGVSVGSKIVQSVASETEAFAVFGDVKYMLNDQLELNIGLRYNDERQDFKQLSVLEEATFGSLPLLPAFATGAVDVSESENKWLPKVGLNYYATDDLLLYGHWSKGHKSGGLNLEGGAGLSVGSSGLFEPEELDAFEVGIKSQLFDNTVTLNVAAYYYDYQDLQVTITVPPTTTLVQNADAEIYGLESEFQWRPNANFELSAAATFTHGRFDGFQGFDDAAPTLGTQDLDDEPLPQAPDFTLNLGAQYTLYLADNFFSSISIRGDTRYSDDVVLRYFGGDINTQESFWLSSLAVTLTGSDDKTTVRLYGNNLGDEEYLQQITYIGAIGSYMGNYGLPRTWGLELSRRF